MMFWIIAAIVVVALIALAWWTSGRAKSTTSDRQGAVSTGNSWAKERNSQHNTRQGGIGGGF